MINPLVYCDFPGATWLIFGPNVAPLVYYSHLPIIGISLLLAVFVFFQNRKALPNRVLFFTILAFVSWVVFDSIYWASNRSDVIMFAWSMDILAEPLVYMGSFYLMYALIARRDLPFWAKILGVALNIPVLILLPTQYILSGFDLSTCLAEETLISYYSYVIEIFFTLCILIFAFYSFLKTNLADERKKIVYLTIGIILFLTAFAWGNITGSFTEDWQLGQYGLFGMPIFIGFLVYSIVRFQTFNIKLISTEALVVALWVTLAAVLTLNSIEYVRIIVSLTLIMFLVVGVLLVRSVRREVEQREHIEKLAKDLEVANVRLKELDQLKSEFVSLANHQLRAPIAAIKGYASLILEGSFGKPPAAIKEATDKIFEEGKQLGLIVEDFLNVSRIEQGKMKYELADTDLEKLVALVAEELSPAAKKVNITLTFDTDNSRPYISNIDPGKIKQVVTNLIDNAIKYTPKGSVEVHLAKRPPNKIRIVIKDTGIGLDKETIPKLFKKFVRAKDANQTNVSGTGLGLYVAKEMVEAHKGRIWVESEGKGKGSTFIVELDEIKA